MSDRPDIEAIEERQRRLDYSRVYHEPPHESGMFMLGDEIYRAKEAQLNALPDLLAYIRKLEAENAALLPANILEGIRAGRTSFLPRVDSEVTGVTPEFIALVDSINAEHASLLNSLHDTPDDAAPTNPPVTPGTGGDR